MQKIKELLANRQYYFDKLANGINRIVFNWYRYRYTLLKYTYKRDVYVPVEIEDSRQMPVMVEVIKHNYIFDTSQASWADMNIQTSYFEITYTYFDTLECERPFEQYTRKLFLYMPNHFHFRRELKRLAPFTAYNARRVAAKENDSSRGG